MGEQSNVAGIAPDEAGSNERIGASGHVPNSAPSIRRQKLKTPGQSMRSTYTLSSNVMLLRPGPGADFATKVELPFTKTMLVEKVKLEHLP